MHQVEFDPNNLHALASRTVVITGGAGGIGAATAKVFNEHGANVVLADIPVFEEKANEIIASLAHPLQALFVPVDILNWDQMTTLFKRTIQTFGALHVVVANAGIMESAEVLDLDDVDDDGNLRESKEAFKVIDVNLKGTLNSMSSQVQTEHDDSSDHALTYARFSCKACNALHEGLSSERRCAAIYHIDCFDFGLLWRNGCFCLYLLEARSDRAAARVSASCTEIRHCSQSNCAVLHPYTYYC